MKNLEKVKETYCIGTSLCILANNINDKKLSTTISKFGAGMVQNSSQILFNSEGDLPCGTGPDTYFEWLHKYWPKPPIPLGKINFDNNKNVLYASSKPLPPAHIDKIDLLNYISIMGKIASTKAMKSQLIQISKQILV